ncbi:hypothetical protein JCM8208_006609 [Rhodotorula glutinis]
MVHPTRFAQLKYVIFSWQNTPLLKRDGLARDFFRSHATMSTLAASLGGFPLTLYEATLPDSVTELWLDDDQCRRLIHLLADSMGPSRAQSSWRDSAYHPRSTLERSGHGPVVARTFASQADLERHFGHLKDQDDWHHTRQHWRELERAQVVYRHLVHAAAASSSSATSTPPSFVAVDVETWEQDHDLVTEVGIASLVLDPGASSPSTAFEHLVLAENAHRRNGRYCPDARDDFQLGTSETLPRADLAARVSARLRLPPPSSSSSDHDGSPRPGPVFLLLHDSRGDVRSLTSLGLDMNAFERTPLLPAPDADPAAYTDVAGAGFLLDTQRLYSGYSRRKRQVRLEDAVRTLGVELPAGAGPVAFHNSGNDAWATLDVFRRLMDVSIGDDPDEVVPPGWTEGGRAAGAGAGVSTAAGAGGARAPAAARGRGRGRGRAPHGAPPQQGQGHTSSAGSGQHSGRRGGA